MPGIIKKGEGITASPARAKFLASTPFFSLLLGVFACLASVPAGFAADSPQKTFELTVPAGALPAQPQVLRVNHGDVVRLRLMSAEAGEIHLHGYRLELKLTPGTAAELTFNARATGRYRVEWHRSGAAAKSGSHHGPALAMLEVRPK